jgi:hypothetical protein
VHPVKKNVLFLLTVVLSSVGGVVQAVTCQSNFPASNPDSIYKDHDDGTVTDTRTGLMWKKCSEGQTWSKDTCTGGATEHQWADALSLAETASFADHNDWRLPNIKELRSLVEECRRDPSINNDVFPNTPSFSYSHFWSGSPASESYSWVVAFSGGLPWHLRRDGPDVVHVRLVRDDR